MEERSATSDSTAIEIAAEALTRTRWSACIYDPEWRLLWVSEELAGLVGTSDADELGLGEHVLGVFGRPVWRRAITTEARHHQLAENIDVWVHDTPGGADAIAPYLEDEGERALLEQAQPRPAPPVWAYGIDYVAPDGPPIHVHTVSFPLRDDDGRTYAYVLVYNTGLPARLTAQLVRGDRGMFERMARLVDPGQHAAAIMFADLEHSGTLSRHIPSASYFAVIRRLSNAMDRAIVERGGIVGKHAGDGVSGFFLSEDVGSPGAAITAAIEAGRAIRSATAAVGDELDAEVPDAGPVLVNIGVHWAPAAYMGQIATEGRLEVTALGDEVNECARIQQSASGGALLASKQALEQLSAEEAASLDLDPAHLGYTTVAELPEASEKARRDAGRIAVARL